MPGKGFFTSIATVLLERPVDAGQIARALAGFPVRRDLPTEAQPKWMGGFPGVLVGYRPEANGAVLVDAIDRRWPDDLGSPADDPELFGAWALGWLGPLTYPGNLERAVAFASFDAERIARDHRAFVRIMTTYALGAGDDAKVVPDDYDAVAELEHATTIASALAALPGVLGVFHPAGETIHTPETLAETLDYHRQRKLLPYAAWSAVRLFRVDASWSVMDTVGMGQLGVRDQEACFTTQKYDPGDIANFLRNVGDYARRGERELRLGDTIDGPGGVSWRVTPMDKGLGPPGRETHRWTPEDGTVPPGRVLVQ